MGKRGRLYGDRNYIFVAEHTVIYIDMKYNVQLKIMLLTNVSAIKRKKRRKRSVERNNRAAFYIPFSHSGSLLVHVCFYYHHCLSLCFLSFTFPTWKKG